MEQALVNFKQERDFGEIFSATFAFIGQEFKRLITAIIIFVGPIMILAGLFIWLLFTDLQSTFQIAAGGNPEDIGDPFAFMGNMFLFMLILILIFAVAYTMLKCTILGYIKLYIEKGKNNFELRDIWGQIMQYYFPVLGTIVLVQIITIIGTMFCIIPGIYLSVCLSIIIMIMILGSQGFSNAFNRSFELVNQKWWLTFGIIIVAGLMVSMISYIFYIPGLLLGMQGFIRDMQNLETAETTFPTFIIVMTTLQYLVYFLLQAIPIILLSFHYFSLVELKDKPSLLEKIDQIESNE